MRMPKVADAELQQLTTELTGFIERVAVWTLEMTQAQSLHTAAIGEADERLGELVKEETLENELSTQLSGCEVAAEAAVTDAATAATQQLAPRAEVADLNTEMETVLALCAQLSSMIALQSSELVLADDTAARNHATLQHVIAACAEVTARASQSVADLGNTLQAADEAACEAVGAAAALAECARDRAARLATERQESTKRHQAKVSSEWGCNNLSHGPTALTEPYAQVQDATAQGGVLHVCSHSLLSHLSRVQYVALHWRGA